MDGGRGAGVGVTAAAARGHHRLASGLLAACIVAGSFTLWLGIPVAWLWLASRIADEYPTFFVVALLGCPLTMAAFGLLLARVNSAYMRVSGEARAARRTAWLRSLSGERRPRRPRALLDMSMTVSVLVALVLLSIWFLLYATNYGPPTP